MQLIATLVEKMSTNGTLSGTLSKDSLQQKYAEKTPDELCLVYQDKVEKIHKYTKQLDSAISPSCDSRASLMEKLQIASFKLDCICETAKNRNIDLENAAKSIAKSNEKDFSKDAPKCSSDKDLLSL